MSDLSTKVRTVAFEETPFGYQWAYERLTSQPDKPLDDRDDALRMWGFIYGVAYGAARGEDSFEPNESVAERAYAAATEVFHDPTFISLEIIKRLEAPAAEREEA